MIKYDITGEWRVGEDGAGSTYTAKVPGDIFADLTAAGVIDDPYYADNSLRCAWVAERDWRYTKEFTADRLDRVTYLVFEGIDTFAEIYLNGAKIAATDNMFMKYRFDVSDKIRIGKNKLEVVIKSIRRELAKYPEEGYFGCFNVQRIFVRKAQCHFSWDWAPDFPAMGIWKNVYIESINDTYIDNFRIRTENDGHVTFFVNLPENCEYGREREIELVLDGQTHRFKTTAQKSFYILKIDNPELWWPRFLGKQPLYGYEIRLFSDGILCDEKKGRFGFRTVRLEEKPTPDADGFTCQLYVNDTPVFLKGANWVPMDVMTGTLTRERYEKAIKLAYDANFSMLRVWGGGIYENDVFYELCDELGIMVWQDFAYACADVPDNIPEFVDRAIAEAEYQVCRLRNFTSLVLYCGGNEKTGSHGLNKKYGDRIIYYYIRGVVDHLDGTRPYFPSSPWGYGDIGNTKSSGDCHCNSYQTAMVTDLADFRDVLKTFKASLVSEIAVQGAPQVSSLKKYIPADRLWPMNEMYDLHFMRNPYDETGKWFSQIQYESAERLFGKIEGLNDFCKKSSMLHSELVRADCEYHKTRIGACSGTMTWMFNDIWPCGTWSVVDYYMQPAPAYYALKRAYRAKNLIITKTEQGYVLYAVNETPAASEFEIEYGLMMQSGGKKLEKKTKITVGAYSSQQMYCFGEEPDKDCVMYALGTADGERCQTTLFAKLWKDISWCEPELVYEEKKNGDVLEITIRTKNYARAVNLTSEKESLAYSDNYFDMLPGEVKTVRISGADVGDVEVKTWCDDWVR